MRRTALAFGALLSSAGTRAQSVTEARFVLNDIRAWLPGEYDNAAQIFVESAFGAGDEGNHDWLHIEVETVVDSDLGDAVFRVTTSDRGDPGKEAKARLVAFSIDEASRAVRMTRLDRSGAPLESDDVLWRRGADHVYGTLPRGADGRADFRLTADELWYDNGQRSDEVPLRFTKVRYYECFALVHHRDGSGTTLRNPFRLHDGDGVYAFTTDEADPRTIEILLRRSLWTSRSGKNFVPLLQLYVYENGDRDEPFANAWSTADSGRVGFAARGALSARCKIPTPKPFQ